MVYFDTRPDAYSDGHWTRFIDKYAMERPHWRKAAAANMRGAICVVDCYGTDRVIIKDHEMDLCESIGLMLKAAMLHARDQDFFCHCR